MSLRTSYLAGNMDAKPQALPLFVLPSLDSTYGSFLIGVFVGLMYVLFVILLIRG